MHHDDNQRMIYYRSGILLRSESGRSMSPFPNIEGAKLFVQRKRLCLWLAAEAEAEIEHDIARRGSRIPHCYESWLAFNETKIGRAHV